MPIGIGIGLGTAHQQLVQVPFLLSGSFIAEGPIATQEYSGFNRDKWVTSHNWDSADAEYGTYTVENDLMCIVISPPTEDNFVGLAFQGASAADTTYLFPDGVSLTIPGINGGDPITLAYNGEPIHTDCFLYVLAAAGIDGFTDETEYDFTIEEVVE